MRQSQRMTQLKKQVAVKLDVVEQGPLKLQHKTEFEANENQMYKN